MRLGTAKPGSSRPLHCCPLCSTSHYGPNCGNLCLILPGLCSLHTSRGHHLHVLWNYAINGTEQSSHRSLTLFSRIVQGSSMKFAAQ